MSGLCLNRASQDFMHKAFHLAFLRRGLAACIALHGHRLDRGLQGLSAVAAERCHYPLLFQMLCKP